MKGRLSNNIFKTKNKFLKYRLVDSLMDRYELMMDITKIYGKGMEMKFVLILIQSK